MTFDKKKYDQKYVKDNYDRIPINVKKGEREIIFNRAKEKGFKSITEYVKDLIKNDINNTKSNINIGEINQNGENNTVQF